MKKILFLLLALVLVLSLCACGGSSKTPGNTLIGKWKCTEGPENFSMEFNKNGSGTFSMDKKSADITWSYVDSRTYEHQDTGETITLYSYNLNWDDATYTMIVEEGKKDLMLSMGGYKIFFTKK